MTDIYHFSPNSHEFSHVTIAQEDPRSGTPIIPRRATLIAPPDAQDGMVRVFSNDAWTQVIDKRGTIYWLADGTRAQITELGVDLPADALLEEPPLSRDLQAGVALEVLENARELALKDFAGNPRPLVVASWSTKASAARAVLGGNAQESDLLLLRRRAAERGQSVEQFAAWVLYKSDLYSAFTDAADTEFERAETLINLATENTVPIEQVKSQIEAALDTFTARVADAATVILSEITPPN